MSSEKTLAIVLRTVEFSETSLVVSLFTEEFGKIGALAKGARRPKGPFEAALDLLSICRIVFLHKSSGGLDLLTEARLERRYRAAARNLPALYAGYYVAELLREMTDEHDPHPELFQVSQETLIGLDENQEVWRCVLRFELAALRLLGHLPSLDICVGCGALVELAGRVPLGMVAGGVLCPRCRHGQQQVVSVSASAVQAMQLFAEAHADWRQIPVERPIRGELRGVLNRYFCNLLGHRPRMHAFLSTTGSASEELPAAESSSESIAQRG